MPAQDTSRESAQLNLNHLRRGLTYRATTISGTAVGEYLGMEAMYGSRSILLRHAAGTDSIDRRDLMAIVPIAA